MSGRHSLHPIVLLVFAALGCSDATAPGKAKDPRFDAIVSGLTARRLTGGATFAADAPGFGLALVEPPTSSAAEIVRHAVYFRRTASGVPQPGEYAIVPESDDASAIEAGVVLDGDSDDPLLCRATAGTLSVISVSDTRLEGRFTITASCARVTGDPLPTPITVAGTFLAARGTLTLPDESTAVAGTRYVLVAVDGQPVPYLYRDRDIPDEHRRMRTWIAADTIHFNFDGQLEHASHFHQIEESMETQEVLDDWEWEGWRGGYFRQNAGKVAVAWAYVTVPSPAQYTDTLRVRHATLVRRANVPSACLMCPVGPEVEWRYERR